MIPTLLPFVNVIFIPQQQVFRRRQQELEKLSSDQIEVQRRELGELERKFLERVASTNRSKTAAALQPAAASGTCLV